MLTMTLSLLLWFHHSNTTDMTLSWLLSVHHKSRYVEANNNNITGRLYYQLAFAICIYVFADCLVVVMANWFDSPYFYEGCRGCFFLILIVIETPLIILSSRWKYEKWYYNHNALLQIQAEITNLSSWRPFCFFIINAKFQNYIVQVSCEFPPIGHVCFI